MASNRVQKDDLEYGGDATNLSIRAKEESERDEGIEIQMIAF